MVLVHSTDMGHKLEIVDKVLILTRGILLELFEFVLKYLKMSLEFRLVLVTLSFDFVLEFSKGVCLLIFI